MVITKYFVANINSYLKFKNGQENFNISNGRSRFYGLAILYDFYINKLQTHGR
jgi:hypothetical protein